MKWDIDQLNETKMTLLLPKAGMQDDHTSLIQL